MASFTISLNLYAISLPDYNDVIVNQEKIEYLLSETYEELTQPSCLKRNLYDDITGILINSGWIIQKMKLVPSIYFKNLVVAVQYTVYLSIGSGKYQKTTYVSGNSCHLVD